MAAELPPTRWEEDSSHFFIRYADAIVPDRQEQMALVVSLIPADPDEAFLVVDLACGEALLSRRILERFPNCSLIALDGSPAMLDRARENLSAFAGRVEYREFNFFERRWLDGMPMHVRCFVSSLAVHHLDAGEKRQLYADLAARLESGGALLLQDIVEPTTPRAQQLYATLWDARVRERSVALTGELAVYERFAGGWNHFATPDNTDTPSGLYEQLRWFEEAGLVDVDCFWLWCGHAIYGGFKP